MCLWACVLFYNGNLVYIRLFTDVVFLNHVYNEHELLWVKYVRIGVRRKVSKYFEAQLNFVMGKYLLAINDG